MVDQAIALDERPYHHCARANILLRLKRFEEAIAEAEAMLEAEPDHWHSVEQIMKGLVGLGRVADAEGTCTGSGSACAVGTKCVVRGGNVSRLARPAESGR